MIKRELRDALDEYGKDFDCEIKILDNPDFDTAIVGVSNDHRVIYDEGLMAVDYAEENECDLIEAYEWLDASTIPSIGFMGENRPIIMEISLDELLEKYGK